MFYDKYNGFFSIVFIIMVILRIFMCYNILFCICMFIMSFMLVVSLCVTGGMGGRGAIVMFLRYFFFVCGFVDVGSKMLWLSSILLQAQYQQSFEKLAKKVNQHYLVLWNLKNKLHQSKILRYKSLHVLWFLCSNTQVSLLNNQQIGFKHQKYHDKIMKTKNHENIKSCLQVLFCDAERFVQTRIQIYMATTKNETSSTKSTNI